MTLLLIPPPGSDLLAPEPGGGCVPTLTWCYSTITDANRWARPGPGMRPHEGVHAAVGLLLVHRGAPVPMGCDRAMRWCRAHPDREKPGIYYPQPRAFWTVALARDVADFARLLGCRIIALDADGREVSLV